LPRHKEQVASADTRGAAIRAADTARRGDTAPVSSMREAIAGAAAQRYSAPLPRYAARYAMIFDASFILIPCGQAQRSRKCYARGEGQRRCAGREEVRCRRRRCRRLRHAIDVACCHAMFMPAP